MAGPRPTIQAFDEGSRFRLLRTTMENPRWVLTQIGALVLSQSMAAFREQRMGNIPWKSRGETGMNPNWPAIIRDFTMGRSAPPSRRFDDRPALIDQGTLSRTFAMRILNQDTVEVGAMAAYADALHSGLETETDPLTRAVQARLWEWIQRARGSAARAKAEPGRREAREQKQAVHDDPQVKQLKAAVWASKYAYQGRKVPKFERERRARLKTKLKERIQQVENQASRASDPLTDKEFGRIKKTRDVAGKANRLTWLLNKSLTGQRLTVKHPARPMVGLPKGLIEKIETLVGVRVRVA